MYFYESVEICNKTGKMLQSFEDLRKNKDFVFMKS